jgi:arylsulfatase A-like enzyme
LRPAGYRSAIIGKWHLGLESPNTPNERGFDHFQGFLGDMMDDYRSHLRHGNNYMRRNREVINPQGHATDLFTDWAIDYLNESKRESKPFFLYLAYNAPHAPVQPPDEWLARVRERSPALSEKRMKLVALVEHLDASIGRVIAQLKQNGQSENTLILFLSDNGADLGAGASSGHLRDGKGSMYEGGIRVPMCAVWPGHITPGLRCSFPAATMDLLPTICEVSGAAVPGSVDGISILPSLLGKAQPVSERNLVFVRREGGPRYEGRDFYALRSGDWKLLHNTPFQPYELYNLREDPLEQHDLAKKDRATYNRLGALLTRHLQRAGATPWQAPSLEA